MTAYPVVHHGLFYARQAVFNIKVWAHQEHPFHLKHCTLSDSVQLKSVSPMIDATNCFKFKFKIFFRNSPIAETFPLLMIEASYCIGRLTNCRNRVRLDISSSSLHHLWAHALRYCCIKSAQFVVLSTIRNKEMQLDKHV